MTNQVNKKRAEQAASISDDIWRQHDSYLKEHYGTGVPQQLTQEELIAGLRQEGLIVTYALTSRAPFWYACSPSKQPKSADHSLEQVGSPEI